jgi:methenyltetrahydromethanopterin cyclohydrolase
MEGTRHMSDLALNHRAWSIADDIATRADELRIAVSTLPSGTRIIDAGINVPGGLAAGIALGDLCMAGLGHISITTLPIAGQTYPVVHVRTDHPAVACMASQYAGWAISAGDYFAMGSGPLRAHARVERELFGHLGYEERAERGVLVLEGRVLPTDEVARWIGEKARLDPARLTLAIAPTASLAGGMQVVARILETGLHKMDTLGFDVRRVVSGVGTAPIPPIAKNDLRAIGRTNDCILYGGDAHYHVDAEDAELQTLVEKLPASASGDHGTPFYDIFKRYGGDFYKIDPLLFSPAHVHLTNIRSGRTFVAGSLEPRVLHTSLYGET